MEHIIRWCPLLSCCCAALLCAWSAGASAQSATGSKEPPLAERFLNPRNERRMLRIYHGWSKSETEREQAVHRLIDQGFGGAVTDISFDNGYTENEANWPPLVSGVAAMQRAGLSMWLYDEAGYPSGRAGHLVLRDHPELEVRGLLIAQATSSGGPVQLKLPPGEPVYLGALPETRGTSDLQGARDLHSNVRDGVLRWNAPEGAWRLFAITQDHIYEGTQVATSGYPERSRYVSLLDPRTTREFLRVTHDRYAQRLGANLGSRFVSTFTDEPSLLSIWFTPMPYAVLPWSDNLPQEFEKRRGYALTPVLPALAADAGPRGTKARVDYWRTVAELLSENYFGAIRNWCHAHHLLSGGHLLLEENILNHVAVYGDAFRCYRMMDAPGIDALSCDPKVPRYTGLNGMGADVPWDAARMASSAAELDGKLHVMCETTDFLQSVTNPNAKLTEEEFRGAFNRLMLGGINSFNTYYGGFGAWTDEQMRSFNLWIGRCCEMLTGGFRRADIAVLYPIETAWTRFTPSRHWVSDIGEPARQVEHISRAVADRLFEARREFAYMDTRTLLDARIDRGALAHRNLRWRVLVLPCVDTLPVEAWQKLRRFALAGGVVVSVAALPTNSDAEFPSPAAAEIRHELFGAGDTARARTLPHGGLAAYLPADSVAALPGLIDAVLEPDVAAAGPGTLRAAHRFVEGHEVYFLVNDGPGSWAGKVTLAVRGPGELWDPKTGHASHLASGKNIALELGPYEAVLARFKTHATPRRIAPKGSSCAGMPLESAHP